MPGKIDQRIDGEKHPRPALGRQIDEPDVEHDAGVDGGEGHKYSKNAFRATEVRHRLDQTNQAEKERGDQDQGAVELEEGLVADKLLHLLSREVKEAHREDEPKRRHENDVTEEPPDFAVVNDLIGVEGQRVIDCKRAEKRDANGGYDKSQDVKTDQQRVRINRTPADPKERAIILRLFVIKHDG
jgi:hypothetical protein